MNEFRPIHISGYDRTDHDFYPTPAWVTEALLKHVTLRGPVWEACCGDGAIARVIENRGHQVVATDLVDHGFGEPGIDFFACQEFPQGCSAMVTNPPYSDGGIRQAGTSVSRGMLRFVRHALTLTERANGQLALLVRFQWMAGQRASDLITSGPLDQVLTLTRRIRWFDMGERPTTGSIIMRGCSGTARANARCRRGLCSPIRSQFFPVIARSGATKQSRSEFARIVRVPPRPRLLRRSAPRNDSGRNASQ